MVDRTTLSVIASLDMYEFQGLSSYVLQDALRSSERTIKELEAERDALVEGLNRRLDDPVWNDCSANYLCEHLLEELAAKAREGLGPSAEPHTPVVDTSHPLAKGLKGCWLLGEGNE